MSTMTRRQCIVHVIVNALGVRAVTRYYSMTRRTLLTDRVSEDV